MPVKTRRRKRQGAPKTGGGSKASASSGPEPSEELARLSAARRPSPGEVVSKVWTTSRRATSDPGTASDPGDAARKVFARTRSPVEMTSTSHST